MNVIVSPSFHAWKVILLRFFELLVKTTNWFILRGVGYPSLWPSDKCMEPLDVSNEFTFKLIEGVLSGKSVRFILKLLPLRL